VAGAAGPFSRAGNAVARRVKKNWLHHRVYREHRENGGPSSTYGK